MAIIILIVILLLINKKEYFTKEQLGDLWKIKHSVFTNFYGGIQYKINDIRFVSL